MSGKPSWLADLDQILGDLEALPRPFVDTGTLERLLGVGRRRAQQILAPCLSDQVGPNGLADRQVVIDRLRQLAAGDASYEYQRRKKLAVVLDRLIRERVEQKPLLVPAPLEVLSQQLENLPPGVALGPGRILVEFDEPEQGLQKLLALAIAISNDLASFETLTKRGK